MKICFKKGFYKGQFDGPYAVGIIAKNIITGNFNFLTHVELRFSARFDKVSFSSVEGEGSRFKQISYTHPYRWIFLEWDLDDSRFPHRYESEEEVFSLCESLAGRPYDWKGIVGEAINDHRINDKKTFYCSEIVAYILGFQDCALSPAELYNKIKALKR